MIGIEDEIRIQYKIIKGPVSEMMTQAFLHNIKNFVNVLTIKQQSDIFVLLRDKYISFLEAKYEK